MHKRNVKKLQAMKMQKIILHNSFHDKKLAEVISRITRLEVMGQLNESIEVHLVPDVEKGEVLLDLRGRGSLQQEMILLNNRSFRPY
jgi:hypothetical protein